MREFHEAATTIQRVVRGHLVRQRVARMHACATAVQRVFRGHRARTAYTALVAQARTEHARTAALLRIRRRAAARETALAHLRATHRSKVAAAADARAHAAATRLQAWFRAVRVRARLPAALRRRRRSSCSRDGATDDAESAGDRSATVAEADVCAARERVIERLFSDAQRRSAATAAAPVTAPASASASAAALLASLRKCQKLLDAYYDAADDDDFEQYPSQGAAVLKFSPDDVSLGCRSLRVRTDSYLKVLLGEFDHLLRNLRLRHFRVRRHAGHSE
ncbi:hypothetical protein HDU84_008583 [Entophlyctis sp. JEL0112]|nr:hypothetical protein HDU84_008583 [Entophlyctis sp. JEL0112]